MWLCVLQDRVLAAKAMVERLSKSHRADIIRDMEALSLAYIEMANWAVDKYKKETSEFFVRWFLSYLLPVI